MKFMNNTTWYEIDAENIVQSVGGDWDHFADLNAGGDCSSSSVIGQPLFQFVTGSKTREFLDSLFYNVLDLKAPFQMLYRCDGPDVKRIFRMVLTPSFVSQQQIRISHTLVFSSSENNQRVINFSDRYDSCRCSMCGAIEIAGEWKDTWTQPDPEYFVGSYMVCPKCTEYKEQQLKVCEVSRKYLL